jgi:hypothetical protein
MGHSAWIQYIVCRIDTLLQITYSDRLDRSILAKAFWGELVEQAPNDEPAAVLLDRIRVEQEQQTQGKAKQQEKKGKRQQENLD